MSEVDHSLHMREFSPWSEIPTRYAADTADVGHDVDDAWKELGVYGKKFFFRWILFTYLPTVPIIPSKVGKQKEKKRLMRMD